jgi:DNA anti-recombination protein RmuC
MATVVDIFEINVQPIAEQLSALGAQIDTAKKKYNELKSHKGSTMNRLLKLSRM